MLSHSPRRIHFVGDLVSPVQWQRTVLVVGSAAFQLVTNPGTMISRRKLRAAAPLHFPAAGNRLLAKPFAGSDLNHTI